MGQHIHISMDVNTIVNNFVMPPVAIGRPLGQLPISLSAFINKQL
jgi:hypothetical protein